MALWSSDQSHMPIPTESQLIREDLERYRRSLEKGDSEVFISLNPLLEALCERGGIPGAMRTLARRLAGMAGGMASGVGSSQKEISKLI